MTKNAEYQAAYYKRHKLADRKALLDYGDNKCALCGYSDIRALEADHTYGGGSLHHNKVGGIGFYKQLLKMMKEGKVRILCRNCNWIEYKKRKNLTT